MSILMPYAYLLLSLPKMRTIPRLIRQMEYGKSSFVAFFGFVNAFLDYALIAVWVLIVSASLMNREITLSQSLIPYLLWGCAVLMAPLVFMASKEHPNSIGSTGGMIFALLGFAALTICKCVNAPFRTALLILLSLMIAFSIFQISIVIFQMARQEKLDME